MAIVFQSTCPVQGTTFSADSGLAHIDISIHVPRTGHDCRTVCAVSDLRYFNPRAPYRARLREKGRIVELAVISIHVPRTGHDVRPPDQRRVLRHISIHVPRTGHDSKNAQIVFCIFAIADNKSGKVIM